jgi:DNA-binding SARP family transcriptional activator
MLRLKTLGGWSAVRADGVPREIPAQRVALLALLVTAGARGVSRDRAASLLWPDSPDEKARHSLGQSLYALRRDADSADVVMGTAVLRLNADVVQCDAWELEAAHRRGDYSGAAGLYDGPFLDAIHLRGSADLQQTVDAERVRLGILHADAVESLARAASRDGSAHEAAQWWRRLATTDPFSSRVALELVQALVADGDKTGALQAARVHETLVRQHLEVEPDGAFTAYVGALRAEVASVHSPSTGSTRVAVVAAAPAATPAPAPVATPNVAPRRARTAWSGKIAWAMAATAVGAAVFAGAAHWARANTALDTKRVYVAWFENRTGDRALDQIGGMASDWVAQGLERTGVVGVASSKRAEAPEPRVSDGPLNATDAARRAAELGAGTLVSGAYYKVGDRLRFQVRISDVGHGEVLDSFDAEGGSETDASQPLETVRQRAMGSLASLVDPRLSSWVRVASKPPGYEAYREFVSGQRIWGSDRREALGHFLRAIALDSTFYGARVEAAILYRLLGECARTESIASELLPVSERLAPYDYHTLAGQVAQCEGDWQRAYSETRAVVDLEPRSAFLAYSLALQAMQLGRYDEAEELLGRHPIDQGVAEVGPNFALIYAQVLSARGDRSRGIEVAHRLRVRYPEYARSWILEATLLTRDGQAARAEALMDTMVVRPVAPSSVLPTGLRRVASALIERGDTAAGRHILTRALALLDAPTSTRGDRASRSERAQILYELGRHDDAEVALMRMVSADSTDVDVRGYVGLVAAACHDSAKAMAADAWLAAARPPFVFTRTLYRARIAAALGRRAQALTLLAAALDEGGRFMVPPIREYAEFASLRQDPEFRRLLALQ